MKRVIFITILALSIASCSSSDQSNSFLPSDTVLTGSYANMITLGDFLYVLGNGQLKTLSLGDPSTPELIDETNIDFSIESIFISGKNIFVGSPEGMFIYTIGEDGIPVFRSQTAYDNFELITCFSDPIAANEEYAYVTLDNISNEQQCFRQESISGLRIYDLENLENPVLLNTIEMDSPKGIGLDRDKLFVCEKVNGVTAFDLTNPIIPVEVFKSDDFDAFDLIPTGGLLMVVGPDTLHQFDYTDFNNITKIGTYSLRD